MSMKMAIFWDVAPCSLVDTDWCFREAYCFQHQDDKWFITPMTEAVSSSETSANIYHTQCLLCLPLDPRFTGSDLAENDGFLREIKISGMSSFGGEVKSPTPTHKILQHIKNLCEVTQTLHRQNWRTFIAKFLPAVLLGVSAGIWQDSSGRWIRNE
jgi:hypothetical protein